MPILAVFYHGDGIALPLRLCDGEMGWRGYGRGYAGVAFRGKFGKISAPSPLATASAKLDVSDHSNGYQ